MMRELHARTVKRQTGFDDKVTISKSCLLEKEKRTTFANEAQKNRFSMRLLHDFVAILLSVIR